MLTQNKLKEYLRYEGDTGHFTWLYYEGRNAARLIGKRAGSLNHRGYRKIKIHGKHYLEHRLAWLYVHGSFPDGLLDHINHVKDDNRISNLRIVNCVSNGYNRLIGTNNTSGYKGVFLRRGKWCASITVNKRLLFLGSFNSKEDAALAWNEAAKVHHKRYAKLNEV